MRGLRRSVLATRRRPIAVLLALGRVAVLLARGWRIAVLLSRRWRVAVLRWISRRIVVLAPSIGLPAAVRHDAMGAKGAVRKMKAVVGRPNLSCLRGHGTLRVWARKRDNRRLEDTVEQAVHRKGGYT